MRHAVLIGTASVALLAGCSGPSKYTDSPLPTRWETSREETAVALQKDGEEGRQRKLTAAEYWQRIANHFAAQLEDDLKKSKAAGAALYIPVNETGEFPFVYGFRELLTTALVRQGHNVRTVPGDGVLNVDVRYSIYRFNPDRAASTYYYGEATMLAAGLLAIGNIVSGGTGSTAGVLNRSSETLQARALGAVAALETLGWFWREHLHEKDASPVGAVPQSEILLTASVTQGDRFVMRYSSIYYVADEDAGLYWTKQRMEGGTRMRVKGGEE